MGDALYKLHAWLSPAYPVGGFAYSHGLEWAISEGCVHDRQSTEDWVATCLLHGAGRTDAILLVQAWRAEEAGDEARLDGLVELALALAPSAERLMETEAQGAAFADVTAAAWGGGGPMPYPLAVGRAAALHGIDLRDTVLLYLQTYAANLISAAVRLVPLGQTEGQKIVAALLPPCLAVRDQALTATLDEIGGCAIRADIAAMCHEIQQVRLFRS